MLNLVWLDSFPVVVTAYCKVLGYKPVRWHMKFVAFIRMFIRSSSICIQVSSGIGRSYLWHISSWGNDYWLISSFIPFLYIHFFFSGELLAWLSVWSEVQMIYMSSSWCHCHFIPVIHCTCGQSWMVYLSGAGLHISVPEFNVCMLFWNWNELPQFASAKNWTKHQ